MLAVALIFFSPVMEGKVLRQGDIEKADAMAKETRDYHQKTGDYVLWNSAMFSGMPIYQVGGNPPVKSVFTPLKNLGTLQILGMERNAGVLFFYLIGFYVALLVLGCSPRCRCWAPCPSDWEATTSSSSRPDTSPRHGPWP